MIILSIYAPLNWGCKSLKSLKSLKSSKASKALIGAKEGRQPSQTHSVGMHRPSAQAKDSGGQGPAKMGLFKLDFVK